MPWNPYLNGLAAAAYVWAIALLISYIASLHHDTPDNLIGSIAALSLFVFSAAVMAFFFFYRPVMLLFDKQKEQALRFFLKTLGIFGAVTLCALLFVV